jgi:hypothetical protein
MKKVERFFRNLRVTIILTVKFIGSVRYFLKEAQPEKGDKIFASGEFSLMRAEDIAEIEAILDAEGSLGI